VAVVDTAVAVDTEVAASEAWNCVALTPSAFGRRFHWCAEHVRQLEGESPFDNLMEVKS